MDQATSSIDIQKQILGLGDMALKSIIYEALISPKPGLIDRYNNGIHRDMSIYTFISSAIALSSSFRSFIRIGSLYSDQTEDGFLFNKLKEAGVLAESKMFTETKGINTHKGAIFIFALTLGALGSLLQKEDLITIESLSKQIKSICYQNILEDLNHISEKRIGKTAGEKLFLKYKIQGIRGEALSGFSVVHLKILPFFLKIKDQSPNINSNDIMVNMLLYIITLIEDTNILKKHGKLFYTKLVAKIKDFFYSDNYYDSRNSLSILKYKELENFFLKNKISPGGSADLLAMTIFIINYFYPKYLNFNIS